MLPCDLSKLSTSCWNSLPPALWIAWPEKDANQNTWLMHYNIFIWFITFCIYIIYKYRWKLVIMHSKGRQKHQFYWICYTDIAFSVDGLTPSSLATMLYFHCSFTWYYWPFSFILHFKLFTFLVTHIIYKWKMCWEISISQ